MIARIARPAPIRAEPKPFAALVFLALLAVSSTVLRAQALPPPLPGDARLDLFPDSADLRASYWNGFLAAPRDVALSRAPATLRGRDGLFRFSSVRGRTSFYLIVAAVKSGPGIPRGREPVYTQGSWIIKRSLDDGRFLQAKVFLKSDPGVFLRIYPDGDRSRLDLVLYGGVINREVPIPVPFERVCVSRMADIVDWTRDLVDWRLFSPRPGLYANVASMVAAIRERLGGLNYTDDGALDGQGRAVHIQDDSPQEGKPGLNCSGFAKWVVDGFYEPLTGTYLDPRAMAERHLGSRGGDWSNVYEKSLDPYFGLDWTRNLALALAKAALPEEEHSLTGSDVDIAPFALFAPSTAEPVNGGSTYEPYNAPTSSLGYAARGLKALLYVLAIRDPGDIYLASVSRSSGGRLTGLWRHYHVAVLAPYFDANGEFRPVVFESDVETSVEALASRVPDEMIHLVRIPALSDFEPPPFPPPPAAPAPAPPSAPASPTP
ncbi:MAG TPA: hypothetical protein VMV90_08645 [Rectinemataceae bacterium]|nr:hypothetical protein [Rectinemataceae bacterium]